MFSNANPPSSTGSAVPSAYSNASRGNRPTGAYGLTFHGVDDSLLVDVPGGVQWPDVFVQQKPWTRPRRPGRVDAHTAILSLLSGSWVELDRSNESAVVHVREQSDGTELLHPFLASVAVVFSWWHGRNALHGGAFAGPRGEAWALLGPRGCGKSTTLGALALAGVPVVTDDLVVVEKDRVFAGPRILDLRPEAAEVLGIGADRRDAARDGSRRRMAVPRVAAEAPVEGWLFLSWGATLALRRLSPGEWLERTAAQLNSVTPGAQSILPLAGGQAWELIRPAGHSSLERAVDEIRTLVGG